MGVIGLNSERYPKMEGADDFFVCVTKSTKGVRSLGLNIAFVVSIDL